MSEIFSFGEWLALRRKALDMTQREVAARTNCALATIKKIEQDERHPSRELAEAIANALRIQADAQRDFVECARGLRPVEVLRAISATSPDQVPTTVSPTAVNLPANITLLIGRTVELAQITRLLDLPACRLLTLVGPGGVGKTRLALESARVQRDHFTDGVVFIPLAAATDASLIPTSIGHSLKLGLSGSADVQLFAYLRDKIILLVLDNCEQLVEGIDWLSDLLANAPGIKLLATSRERLQLAEEWIYDVPMLDEMGAVDLFRQTAQRLNPSFQSRAHLAAVSRICQLVENLPLALELAASWTPFLSCEQIAHNIQRDIDFLSANVRNVPERHRSIRAVFDHSWRLLSLAEQNVMMRLSVFRGGWTAEEAESIAGASLLMLRALVEKSLVRVVGQERYDLHVLIRQYAADQLRAADQESVVRQQHSKVYLALAGKLRVELSGPSGINTFTRFDEEQDNMRAGISWALETGEMDGAREYVDKLFLYWQRRGHWKEGERWSKAAEARTGEGDSTLLCWVLLNTSVFLAMQGRYSEAFLYKPRAMGMAMRLEDPETLMRYFMIEAQASLDMTVAAKIWEEFFALGARLIGDSKGEMAKEAIIASGHFLYGDTLRDAGHHEDAARHYHQSLDLYRQIGNVDMIAYPIGNLGRLALQDGRINEAYLSFKESLAISRAIGNRVGIADWLQQLGNAALVMSDLSQAESCYEEALALYQEMGNLQAYPDVLAALGYVALVKGNWEQSRHYLRDSLSAYRKFGEPMGSLGIGWSAWLSPEFRLCIQAVALLDIADGKFKQALMLLGVAEALQSKWGYAADIGIQTRVDDGLTTIRSQLSEAAAAQVWESSQSMSVEQVWATISET